MDVTSTFVSVIDYQLQDVESIIEDIVEDAIDCSDDRNFSKLKEKEDQVKKNESEILILDDTSVESASNMTQLGESEEEIGNTQDVKTDGKNAFPSFVVVQTQLNSQTLKEVMNTMNLEFNMPESVITEINNVIEKNTVKKMEDTEGGSESVEETPGKEGNVNDMPPEIKEEDVMEEIGSRIERINKIKKGEISSIGEAESVGHLTWPIEEISSAANEIVEATPVVEFLLEDSVEKREVSPSVDHYENCNTGLQLLPMEPLKLAAAQYLTESISAHVPVPLRMFQTEPDDPSRPTIDSPQDTALVPPNPIKLPKTTFVQNTAPLEFNPSTSVQKESGGTNKTPQKKSQKNIRKFFKMMFKKKAPQTLNYTSKE